MPDRIRVLIVDDEEVLRQMVARVLKYMGIESESAADGFLGLEKLKASPFDLVIADIRMPNMDGIELLKIVKSEYPRTDVVIMTAHSAKYSFIDVVESGATDFINKPFSVEELKAKVERVLRERKHMDELRQRTEQLLRAYEELLALNEGGGGQVAGYEKDFLAAEIGQLKKNLVRLAGGAVDA